MAFWEKQKQGWNLLARRNGIMDLTFSMKQQQKDSGFFLMVIWENMLDSVSRTIFDKAFKPSVLPDLCRKALNLSYSTWSGLQPSGKIWDGCCVPCWANSTLLQLWVPNPWGWNRMGLWQCVTTALCLLGLLLGCGKCYMKGTLENQKFIPCSVCRRKSTQQVSPWPGGKCSLGLVREDLALVSGCWDTSLLPSHLCVVPAES